MVTIRYGYASVQKWWSMAMVGVDDIYHGKVSSGNIAHLQPPYNVPPPNTVVVLVAQAKRA